MRYKRTLLILCLAICLFAVPVFAENQDGKVQIFGGKMYISEDQKVSGDSVAIFADQEVNGKVNGTVVTIFGDLTLKGEVDEVVTIFGDVDLKEGAIVRGDLVNVMGNLRRFGDTRVMGEVTMVGMGEINSNFLHNFRFPIIPWNGTYEFGNLIFSILITALLIHFFLPYLENTYRAAVNDPVRTGIIGALGKVVIVMVGIFMGITIIGIPVAMFLGLAAWAAYSFANVAIYLLIGERVAEQMNLDVNPYVKGIIGSVIVNILAAIPLLGLIKMLIGWIGFGAVLETKFGTGQKWVK